MRPKVELVVPDELVLDDKTISLTIMFIGDGIRAMTKLWDITRSMSEKEIVWSISHILVIPMLKHDEKEYSIEMHMLNNHIKMITDFPVVRYEISDERNAMHFNNSEAAEIIKLWKLEGL